MILKILLMMLVSLPALAQRGMVVVPAGGFQMGCSVGDDRCGNDEGKPGGINVTLDAFYIDKYEVTVDNYTACVNAEKCTLPKDHASNKYCNYNAEGRSNHPVNCVDWQQAADFCAFKNKRLPYEAEWEKAARAEHSGAFPWAHPASCKYAIMDDGRTTGSVTGEHGGCGEDRTWPVGSLEPTPFQIYDMHGNVGEWTANWYAPNAIEAFYSKGDLAGPPSGRQRVVRGGSWDNTVNNLRSSYRSAEKPVSGNKAYSSIGFRCAMDLEK